MVMNIKFCLISYWRTTKIEISYWRTTKIKKCILYLSCFFRPIFIVLIGFPWMRLFLKLGLQFILWLNVYYLHYFFHLRQLFNIFFNLRNLNYIILYLLLTPLMYEKISTNYNFKKYKLMKKKNILLINNDLSYHDFCD